MTLNELREALKKAKGPSRELDAAIYNATNKASEAFKSPTRGEWVTDSKMDVLERFGELPAYTSSLDAAVGLVERVIGSKHLMLDQGWRCDLPEGHATANIIDRQYGAPDREGEATAPTLELAICLALTRAMETETGRSHP